MTIASYTFNLLFGKTKPYEFLFKMKIALIGFIAMGLLPDNSMYLFSRFMQGLVTGYAHRCAISAIRIFTHKAHRPLCYLMMNLMYSFGQASTFYISHFVTEKVFNWRLLYGIILGMALLDMIIFTCAVSINISPFHVYKKKGRKAAKEMISYYLNTIAMQELLRETRKFVAEVKDIEDEEEEENTYFVKATLQTPALKEERSNDEENNQNGRLGLNKKSSSGIIRKSSSLMKKKTKAFSALRSRVTFWKKNKKVIGKTYLFGLFMSLSCFIVFRVYAVYLITEDIYDPVQFSRSKIWLSYAAGADFIINIIIYIFDVTRYRKWSIVSGLAIFCLTQIGHGFSQRSQSWNYSLWVPIITYPVITAVIESSFFNFTNDLFSRRLRDLPEAHVQLFNVIGCIAFPFLDPKVRNNENIYLFSWTIGGGAFLSCILFSIFTFETKGKSDAEIKKRMTGIETFGGKKGRSREKYKFQP
jgi:hypothetical protein